jgi:hypothetical protein
LGSGRPISLGRAETSLHNAHTGPLARPRNGILADLAGAIELDEAYRRQAREDDDFASLHDDPDFIALTQEPEPDEAPGDEASPQD